MARVMACQARTKAAENLIDTEEGIVESSKGGYQLGSDPTELERLRLQGRVLAPATRMLLEAAGISSGMRVLDLGSGAGDVAFLAAELVGPSGEVVGVDRSAESLSAAEARAHQQGITNVRFVVGDIHEPAPEGPFDAIVCRYVLMYVPDPAAVLKAQAAKLRSGGLVVPIEHDLRAAGTIPVVPLVQQSFEWLIKAFERTGIEPALGPQLWATIREADLHPLGMLGIQPHFGPDDPDGPALLAGIVRTVLPLMERTGVATAREVAIDTLRERLSGELASREAVFVYPKVLGAWGTLR
jgi:SAM-dependent methyltransferase